MRKVERAICDALCSGRKTAGESVKLSKRDRVDYEDGQNVYRLHGHAVAYFDYCNRRVILDHCGWATKTTKSRINAIAERFLLPRVYQKDWSWTWSDHMPYGGPRSFDIL